MESLEYVRQLWKYIYIYMLFKKEEDGKLEGGVVQCSGQWAPLLHPGRPSLDPSPRRQCHPRSASSAMPIFSIFDITPSKKGACPR